MFIDTRKPTRTMSYKFTFMPQEIARTQEFMIAHATRGSQIEKIEKWLDDGADVNQVFDVRIGQTILHMAAMFAQTNLIELAINRGADPHIKSCEGYTALHYACIMYLTMLKDSNQQMLAEKMLSKSDVVANMDAKKSIDMLIAAGADVNAVNDAGQTPFDLGPTYLPSFQDTMTGGGLATKGASLRLV